MRTYKTRVEFVSEVASNLIEAPSETAARSAARKRAIQQKPYAGSPVNISVSVFGRRQSEPAAASGSERDGENQ